MENPESEYEVVLAENAEAEIDSAFSFWLTRNPDFASLLREALYQTIRDLPLFPGPYSHPVDEEASDLYGFEVRRALFSGLRSRRLRIPYRILFTVLGRNSTRVIRILRVIHGSQLLVSPPKEP